MACDKNYVKLFNGYEMPLVGLGTWQTSDESSMEAALRSAIDAGYRHIDTAYVYLNEHFIGKALKKIFDEGKIKRSELFIVTKLPANGMSKEYVEYFLRKSLAALQLDYVDLYLIHSPIYSKKTEDDDAFWTADEKGFFIRGPDIDLVDTWKAMEALVDKGLTRSIGVSNFNSKQIQRILDNARIKPANLQVECHAYLPQYELHDFCKKNGISFTAYSPLGSPGFPAYCKEKFGKEIAAPNMLQDPKLKPLSEKYNKTPAQILLRFLVQRDIIVIPKSSNPERIKQNIDIFDFSLSEEDMNVLKSIKTSHRYFQFNIFPGVTEHPEFPFLEPF